MALQGELSSLKQERDGLVQKNESMASENQIQRHTIQTLESLKKSLESQISDLQTTQVSLNRQKALEFEISETTEVLTNLQSRYTQLQSAHETICKERDALKAMIAELPKNPQ